MNTITEHTARAVLAHLLQAERPITSHVPPIHDPLQLIQQMISGVVPEPLRHRATPDQVRAQITEMANETTRAGARILIPGDDDWPAGLADLATSPDAEPGTAALCLWVRGRGSLAEALSCSVAVTGSRASSSYGNHVAGEIARGLAHRHVTVVNSGGFGIDGAALRGALTTSQDTIGVVVQPRGLDRAHPSAHTALLDQLVRRGLLVSIWPPDAQTTLARFTITQRLIATLTTGTVLVEAANHSRALTALRHALRLNRPAMVVPGPVTSAVSAGTHQALREHPQTILVCDAADVLAALPGSSRKNDAPDVQPPSRASVPGIT